MTSPASVRDEELDHETRLAELLGRLMDDIARGEQVDFNATCAAYPDLAEELRELWGTVLVTDVAGAWGNITKDGLAQPALVQESELPRMWGDYELLEELGRGGMGVVYRARQISLNREVALKKLARGQWASDEELQRFRAETSAAARLEHPRIVKVYEVGEVDGQAYFAMQLIRGETLGARLKRGPMSGREAARVLREVAQAIDYAHRCGVLHRDLKPSNILLDESRQPHISDFGLAKLVTANDDPSLTRSGAMVGTPMYMSPEQATTRRGKKLGPASDVYSLGAMLYHMLVGAPPFQAESPVALVMKVLEQEPPPPRTIRPEIDRDLEMIVTRCLQKPADLRYASAAELADDLDAFLKDEPISARSGQFVQIVSRLFRETHHAVVLENWGLLWMWHGVVLFVMTVFTWWMQHTHVSNRFAYAALWTVGLGMWAAVFWWLRRRLGPVTFVERQIAHLWASSMISIAMLYPLEGWLGLPVLTLSPLLAVTAGMVFLIKAAMLNGTFYLQSAALVVTSLAMAYWPDLAHLFFGVVAGLSFFLPGYKYHRQRLRESVEVGQASHM